MGWESNPQAHCGIPFSFVLFNRETPRKKLHDHCVSGLLSTSYLCSQSRINAEGSVVCNVRIYFGRSQLVGTSIKNAPIFGLEIRKSLVAIF